METSLAEMDHTILSLFVNPSQFNDPSDFENYPRTEDADLAMARDAGAHIVFAPAVDDIYSLPCSSVHVAEVGDLWEGEFRPGHFDGVATIVAKLFNIVEPDVAYFGQKDLQQCVLIERMVRDLDFKVMLRRCPTIREPDGLAMSSRNTRLGPDQRRIAPRIYESLSALASSLRIGKAHAEIGESLSQCAIGLATDGFRVEYLAYVDGDTMLPLQQVSTNSYLIMAAWLGEVRLIDNVAVM